MSPSPPSPPSPLFARAFDFARETLSVAERFPRHRRAVLGRRLEEACLDFHEAIVRAARTSRLSDSSFTAAVEAADDALATHGFALRLAVEHHLLTPGRYGEVSRLAAECGRLLGGLVKATRQRPLKGAHPGSTRGFVEQHTEQPARLEPQQKGADGQE